ncbi:hypothetical protein [Methylobacterium sp. R2-1]|uniref:hypothetical protein n=1 Tax=Methylobacterium sp. R2-1 TaxID=2587064 RepID=UPI00161AA0BB|nr:hypothetical protein [Methylobacterium sp. R2-1]MBB2965205.1 hypothetical protein [Methylobacterium sp. R2-1]
MFSDQKATATEIEPNRRFEAKWGRAQAVLQGIVGLIVLAGLLGIFGDGWLSTTSRSFTSVPLSVTYQRLLRANAPSEIIIRASAPLPAETLEIGVGSSLLDDASITTTEPGAKDVAATPEGITYRFVLGRERTGTIKLRLAPRLPGRTTAVLSVAGEDLSLPLFIYP